MRSMIVNILLLSVALIGGAAAIPRVSMERDLLRREEGISFVIPSSVAKIAALEFKGIFSDVIFSKTMTYYGGKVIRKEKLTEAEWEWIYENMDVATDLDPYFLDPYYFGSVNMAWEANKVKEANALLEKAVRYRSWDWTLPFYLGFNHFYFLQDNEKAASYLMEAAKLPGSSALLPTFAARLAYKGNKTENAIIFLEESLRNTEDESTRWIYGERLKALKAILFLERAVAAYEKRFDRRPAGLSDLIKEGIIKGIPPDPYGGEFYIDADGSIKTTSELVFKK